MNASSKTVPGAARALWFFELEKAIDEAQWLAWRIGAVEGRNVQALELYVRLEMVRAEVEALRGHSIRRFFDVPASTAFPDANGARDGLDTLRNLATSGEGLEE